MREDSEKLQVSVLMAVYYKDNPEFLVMALDSMIRQTYSPNEIVIVEDGPLSQDLKEVLDAYEQKYPKLFSRIRLENNQGLGSALGIGVEHCKNDLIARMDSDDISCENRLELEVEEFRKEPCLALLGGAIEEFEKDPALCESVRMVPTGRDDIYQRIKSRNPFNHMTVMFRRQAVLEAGNYPKVRYIQDYYLWIKMVHRGYYMKNLKATLVYARTGAGMFTRRGGGQYFAIEKEIQKTMLEYHMITHMEYVRNLIIRRLIRKMDSRTRKFFYAHFLRERKIKGYLYWRP